MIKGNRLTTFDNGQIVATQGNVSVKLGKHEVVTDEILEEVSDKDFLTLIEATNDDGLDKNIKKIKMKDNHAKGIQKNK